ncbi:MAG: hypothetical protein ACJ780_00510 [Solirubrobacteraceae bacterium]
MKRFAVLITALAVLVPAATSLAAINTYSAGITPTSKQAGTPKKPVPMGYTENLQVHGVNGNRAGIQLDIKTRIYGLVENGKDFPTCTLTQIADAHADSICPRGAKVASGYITAALGSASDFKAAGAACNPQLDVWNSGQGKLTFFFVETGAHQCLGGALKTGATGPYPATYKQVGKYLEVDVPIPNYISYPIPGLVGSLESEHLTFLKVTRQVHGKTVAATSSIGCHGKSRPYSATFTSTLPSNGPAKEIHTVAAAAAC